MVAVHTFGDANSSFGWSDLKKVTIHWIGTKMKMLNGSDALKYLDVTDYKITRGDVLIFSYGEADCRVDVGKNDDAYQATIDGMVSGYLACLDENAKKVSAAIGSGSGTAGGQSGKLPVTFCVFNVPPPMKANDTSPYIVRGSDEQRLKYVRYANDLLRRGCLERGWVFFDVFDKYSDGTGFMDPSRSQNGINVSDPVFLKEFLEGRVLAPKTLADVVVADVEPVWSGAPSADPKTYRVPTTPREIIRDRTRRILSKRSSQVVASGAARRPQFQVAAVQNRPPNQSLQTTTLQTTSQKAPGQPSQTQPLTRQQLSAHQRPPAPVQRQPQQAKAIQSANQVFTNKLFGATAPDAENRQGRRDRRDETRRSKPPTAWLAGQNTDEGASARAALAKALGQAGRRKTEKNRERASKQSGK